MAAMPDYDRVASVLVAIALRLVEEKGADDGCERIGEAGDAGGCLLPGVD